MKIGIFGGTFNPPHRGHINSAKQTQCQLGLDKLLVIPTAMPPHKELPEHSPTPEMRLEMARLAFEGIKNAAVSDMEIKRGGKSYTKDTLLELKALYKDAEIWLIMGEDMFLSIESWYGAEWILANTGLAVFARDVKSVPVSHSEKLKSLYGTTVELISTEPVNISSTSLRSFLKKRKGREYLSEEVYTYIIKNRLYGAAPDFDWLREKSRRMYRQAVDRRPHLEGIEQEAVRLARRWGCNQEEARTAAILHDITKSLDTNEQLKICEKYGTIIDVAEKRMPKLLHAISGALVAYHEFGVSDEVYNAIRWHTTGRENMSLLEKIIYLADYIEPSREFDGLERLRSLAYTDIDGALKLGLEMSLRDMKRRGVTAHQRTRNALDYLVSKEG
ncbi:MAG: nicotinate (nicotinamide) nucleotide adenylyltransferase [Clostridiales bacterium]|nr:nicotinate (nicotinamide) nucleotide adenylyltransferase [Clostridiales bacterium]